MISKPKFDYGLLEYYRDEREGYVTLIPKFHQETRELIANQTAIDVLKLCDGSRSVEEIIDRFSRSYPHVDTHLLTNDVNAILASYTRLGTIIWDGENPFKVTLESAIEEDIVASLAQEEELPQILDLIGKFGFESPALKTVDNYCLYRSPFIVDNELSAVSIRYRLFSFFEDFFLLRRSDELIGMISIQMPFEEIKTAATLKTVISPRHVAARFLEYALGELRKIAIRDIHKVEVFVKHNQAGTDMLLQSFNKASFIDECELIRDEVGIGSRLKLMSYFYDSKLS